MGLLYEEIDDLVNTTMKKFIARGAFVDMQTDLTQHVAVNEMWKKKKKVFDGGHDWEFQIQMDHNHSARAIGMYENDGSSLNDTMVVGKVSPRFVNVHYLYDQLEAAFQRGGAAITDLIQTRYTGMMVSLYEYLEEVLWGKPADSSDGKTPFGIGYWVTKNATTGFYGGNPAGFSDGRAGISTTLYPRFANYTGTYASVSTEDLLRKLSAAMRRTKFTSVVSHAQPTIGSDTKGIYVNDTTIGLLEELLETKNMSAAIRNDLSGNSGTMTYKSTPVVFVPYLNNDSTNPVYTLQWKTLGVGVMSGWENNLSAPQPVPGKSTVRRVDLHAGLNMVCTDLRPQSVLYQAAA